MRCDFSELAENDLEAIGDYIAADNPRRAVGFIRELRDHCTALAHAPERVVVDEMDGLAVRMAVHGNYNIYFLWLEAEEAVFILHIRHSARQKPNFNPSGL